MKKTALITGISGQDGSYLAEYLLKKNYKVVGTTKNLSKINKWRLKRLKIHEKIIFDELNLNSKRSIDKIFEKYNFHEFYNLAGHSFVANSFDNGLKTANSTALGVLRILEAIKKFSSGTKFYQASSSEIFGDTTHKFQDESSVCKPKNPYAISKLFAHLITKNFREYHNIFAVSGILYNHESPLRGEEFLTRKIVKGLVEVLYKKRKVISVGNLDSKRDWGFAKEYIDAMWKMMQQKKPDDFVISNGRAYTVKNFIDLCLKYLNIKGKWIGKKNNKKFVTVKNETIIKVDKKFIRKKEYKILIGDYSKAKKRLKWKPKTELKDLVKLMIDEEKFYQEKI